MPHERLNALLASFIPLIPLLFQPGVQDIGWGRVVIDSKPFAPRYLPPVLELPKDEALSHLYSHADDLNFMPGLGWLLDTISQPLNTSLLVTDALRALRSHFQVNAITSSLLLWVVGLLFLAVVSFLYPADIQTSSPGVVTSSCNTSAQVPSANTCPTYTLAPRETAKSEYAHDWQQETNDTTPLPSFGIPWSMRSPLTPIAEEEEIQDQTTTSPLTGGAEANEVAPLLSRSSSSHLSSSLSSRSLDHPLLPNLPSKSHVISTPSRPSEADAGKQFLPLLDGIDVSYNSSDFVFTVIPPSTSDLDVTADPDSPTSSRGEGRETVPSTTISDIPSITSSTQLALSSPLFLASFVGQLSEHFPVDDQFEEARGPRSSLEGTDRAKRNDDLIYTTTAAPILCEEPQPAVEGPCQPPSPARSWALSNITEITEPSDTSNSLPGTPRVEWFSSIHGQLASLDHHGLAFHETSGVADEGTMASTPEVDGESHWSLVDVPSTMDDFLPLSTSTPSLQSTVSCQLEQAGDSPLGDATSLIQEMPCPEMPVSVDFSFGGATNAATPELPASPELVASPLVGPVDGFEAGVPTSRSSGGHVELREDNGDGTTLDETTVPLPLAASVVDMSPEAPRSPPHSVSMNADQAAPKIFDTTVSSTPVVQSCLESFSAVDVCPSLVSPEAPVSPSLPAASSQPQKPTLVAPDRPSPPTTFARRASKVLVSRTGIAGQQVSLTDAGLAQLVARLDKPLLLEEDVRGERRRMERVTNGAVAEHSADRGEPRHGGQMMYEPGYVNEPLSPRVDRNIIDAAHHRPLKNDPYIRIPVCEVGRSRSSGRVRSTTNVVLVRKPSVSTSPQDVSAVAASPLLLPRNWDHRRAQSEAVNRSPAPIAGDQNRRPSYAAVAAKGVLSQPPPRVSDAMPQSSAVHVGSTIKAKVEPVEVRLRTTSAPALSTSPPTFRSGQADVELASWRKGNRWSALVAPTSAEVLPANGKERTRSHLRGFSTLDDRDDSPEKRWPQSRLLKTPTRAPTLSVWMASEWRETCPSPPSSGRAREDAYRSPDSTSNGMRGSMLSATARAKLRDLALSARQNTVDPRPVPAPSPSPCLVRSDPNLGSGSCDSLGSGAISASSGFSSSGSEAIVDCSGTTHVPASFAEPELVVAEEAPAERSPPADLPEAGAGPLATSSSPAAQSCPDDMPPPESVLLLPDCSTTDMDSATLDEPVDLVIVSQECRPPSPAEDCPPIVRLNAMSRPSPMVPSFSFCPAVPVVDWTPRTSVMVIPSYRPSAVVPSRHDFAPEGIAVPLMPARDLIPGIDPTRPLTLSFERPIRPLPGHGRAMSAAFLERGQRSMGAAEFEVRSVE